MLDLRHAPVSPTQPGRDATPPEPAAGEAPAGQSSLIPLIEDVLDAMELADATANGRAAAMPHGEGRAS